MPWTPVGLGVQRMGRAGGTEGVLTAHPPNLPMLRGCGPGPGGRRAGAEGAGGHHQQLRVDTLSAAEGKAGWEDRGQGGPGRGTEWFLAHRSPIQLGFPLRKQPSALHVWTLTHLASSSTWAS